MAMVAATHSPLDKLLILLFLRLIRFALRIKIKIAPPKINRLRETLIAVEHVSAR